MKKLIISVFIATSFQLFGQADSSKINVTVQIRPRTEMRNGQGALIAEGQDAALFVSNRARIGVGYQSGRINLKLAAQSVGVWGQSAQIETDGKVMINEAWAKLKFNKNMSLTVGRQALIYDSERILGGLDWHVSGRFHDLALFNYTAKKWDIDLGAAVSANGESRVNQYYYATGQPYKNMQLLHFNYKFSQPLRVSILALNTGFQSGTDTVKASWETSYTQTLGGNIYYEKPKLQVHALGYVQTGTDQKLASVNAYMLALTAKLDIAKSVKLLFGADYLSGNDNHTTDKTQRAFNPLYGTNHGFYGYMDYFYVGNYIGKAGLADYNAGFDFKINSKFTVSPVVHIFSTTATVTNPEVLPNYLGTEADLTFKYKFWPGVTLVGGYSQMFASTTMEVVQGISNPKSTQNWVWLMLNVDLEIFKTTTNK